MTEETCEHCGRILPQSVRQGEPMKRLRCGWGKGPPWRTMFTLTTYSTHSGPTHEAVKLSWEEVTEILGEDHEGTPEQDGKLVQYLADHGAPDWVDTAEGWIDEHGWGLIGPEKDD